MQVYAGKEVMVFDSRLWRANGGDSKTGDDFFRKATILKVYSEEELDNPHGIPKKKWQIRVPMTMIDVRFEHDGYISKAHFAKDTKDIHVKG